MDEADAKENRPRTPETLSNNDRIVGSGSSWGQKERDLFRIKTSKHEFVPEVLIGKEWFDFSSLNEDTLKCTAIRCCTLIERYS